MTPKSKIFVFLKTASVAVFTCVALVIMISTHTERAISATTKVSSGNEWETALITQLNAERQNRNLPAYTEGGQKLKEAANVRAKEAEVLWSHTRPNGEPWWTVNDSAYGECLAKGYPSPADVITAWMESKSHRDVILDTTLTSIAVSIHTSNGVVYVAAEFN